MLSGDATCKREIDTISVHLRKRHQRYQAGRVEIGLILTKRCPVGCRHCISDCVMDAAPLPDITAIDGWIQDIAATGTYKVINLTGGDPFIEFDKLVHVTESISRSGILPTVLTSGYWATNDKATYQKIERLVKAGLYSIAVSVDQFHQEKIPIQKVKRVLVAAVKLGIRSGICLSYFEYGDNAARAEQKLKNDIGIDLFNRVDITKGSIARAGRATQLDFPFFPQTADEPPSYICNALGMTILENGNVAACCGSELPEDSPLLLGNLNKEPFENIKRRFEQHPLIPFIELFGLIYMESELRLSGNGGNYEKFPYIPPENVCDFCHSIVQVDANVKFFAEKFSDPHIRRRLGVRNLFMYGDTRLLVLE